LDTSLTRILDSWETNDVISVANPPVNDVQTTTVKPPVSVSALATTKTVIIA
jgi:hypothetical protein